MQMSGDPSAGEAVRLRNPLDGTVLASLAGSRREIEFDVHNDSPDVAAFRLEIEGAVTEWAAGTGTDGLLVLAPSGSGTMRLRLAPPLGAAAGDYDFRVRVVTSDGLVMQNTSLTLRVETSVAEIGPQAVMDTTQAGNRSVAPLSSGDASALSPPLPAANGQTSQDIAPSRLNGYPSASNASAPTSASAAAATLQDAKWTGEDAPDEEPLNFITLSAPAGGDDETDAFAENSVLDPKEGASLSVRPGETLLVRFGFTNTGVQEITYILDEDRSLPQGWAMLVQDQVNLTRNGSGEVSMRLTPPVTAEPGEYPFVVMFGLQGGTLMSRTLVLAVIATPAVRLKTQQPRITIRPFYQSARFALEVSSAGNADTAFRISVKRSEETAKDASAKEARQGARKQATGQAIQEQPSENLDADENTDNNTDQNKDVYETEQWQYLFDRELDDLRSPAPNRPPQPVTIYLRLRRRGWWWLGMRETHRVRVSAVPVTEPENGGVPGNSVELTAVRWRLTPFPALFLAPLFVLLLILFAGQPGEIKADGFYYTTPNDKEPVYYVTDPPGPASQIQFHWTAGYYANDPSDTEHPAHSNSIAGRFFRWVSGNFALLKLTGFRNGIAMQDVPSFHRGPGKYSKHVSEDEGSRIGKYEFILTNFFGGSAIQRAMFYTVNTYAGTPLCVTTRVNNAAEHTWIGDKYHRIYEVADPIKGYQALSAAPRPAPATERAEDIKPIDLYAKVHDHILLTLVNLAPRTDSVNYILAKGRDTYDRNKKIIYHDEPGTYHQLEYLYLNNAGSITYRTKENPTANRIKIPIEVTDRAIAGTTEELVFVTTSTDFSMVKVRIHIVATPQTPRTPGTPAASVHPASRAMPASRGGNR